MYKDIRQQTVLRLHIAWRHRLQPAEACTTCDGVSRIHVDLGVSFKFLVLCGLLHGSDGVSMSLFKLRHSLRGHSIVEFQHQFSFAGVVETWVAGGRERIGRTGKKVGREA